MTVLTNARHELFAQAMAKGKTAEEAYAEAGYKPHRSNASRMSANDSVTARVAEILADGAEKASVTISGVLRELSRLGFADIRQVFDSAGGLRPIQDWPDDLAASVASVEVVTKSLPGEADDQLDAQPHGGALARRRNPRVEYVHKIRFWDKNSALEKIARHLGMFADRLELTGVNGGPVEQTIRYVALDKASAQIVADLVK